MTLIFLYPTVPVVMCNSVKMSYDTPYQRNDCRLLAVMTTCLQYCGRSSRRAPLCPDTRIQKDGSVHFRSKQLLLRQEASALPDKSFNYYALPLASK